MEALQRTIRRIALGQAIRGSDVQKVPTDEVISPFFFDDTPLYRNAVSCWKLRFNNVLDGDKLHAALARLLEMEGWRKLGGRFRLNVRTPLSYCQESRELTVQRAKTSLRFTYRSLLPTRDRR